MTPKTLFYCGAWQTGPTLQEIREPGTGRVIDTVAWASDDQAEAAARDLARAFATTRILPAYRRAEILEALARGLAAHRDALAETIAREAGKPIRLAQGEVERALITTRWAAQEALRWNGEMWRLDIAPAHRGRWGVWFRVPRGPVLAITPFNFPLNLVLHKITPAMALGAPFLIKPAPKTPLTALALTRLILEAGWPPEGVAVLPCSNDTTRKLVENENFAVVSFTGSAAVGWMIKSRAGRKKVVLELGGNAGVVVHHDADLAYAAQRCAYGAFVYAGQVCISVQRIFVHEQVWEPFIRAFIDATRAMKVGPIHDPETLIGPMISPAAAERVQNWVRDALDHGARALVEGRRDGDWIHPWVLCDVPHEMNVYCEEVFGPVVVLETYREFDDAIQRINDGPYGLQAGVFTRDWDLIQRAMDRIWVGGLIVNDIPTLRVDPMPYGGMKASGFGREGLRFAMEELSDIRMVVFTHRD